MTNIDGTILCITIKQQHKENSYLRYRVITESFMLLLITSQNVMLPKISLSMFFKHKYATLGH